MKMTLTPISDAQTEALALAGPLDDCSLALIIAESELHLVQAALHGSRKQAIIKVHVLNGRAGSSTDTAPDRAGHLHFSCLDEFVAACAADMLVISERRELIRREAALAVIELSLKGISVCTLTEFLNKKLR